MAGKPKLPEERRSQLINVSLTDEEAREIRDAAEAAGVAFARAREVRRLAINIRQLALPTPVEAPLAVAPPPPAPKIARRRGRRPKLASKTEALDALLGDKTT
jgi:hypothetical protein